MFLMVQLDRKRHTVMLENVLINIVSKVPTVGTEPNVVLWKFSITWQHWKHEATSPRCRSACPEASSAAPIGCPSTCVSSRPTARLPLWSLSGPPAAGSHCAWTALTGPAPSLQSLAACSAAAGGEKPAQTWSHVSPPTAAQQTLQTNRGPGSGWTPYTTSFPQLQDKESSPSAIILGPPLQPRLLCNILPLILHSPCSTGYMVTHKFKSNSRVQNTILSPDKLTMPINECCSKVWRYICF